MEEDGGGVTLVLVCCEYEQTVRKAREEGAASLCGRSAGCALRASSLPPPRHHQLLHPGYTRRWVTAPACILR